MKDYGGIKGRLPLETRSMSIADLALTRTLEDIWMVDQHRKISCAVIAMQWEISRAVL